jgi:hypothetical protein
LYDVVRVRSLLQVDLSETCYVAQDHKCVVDHLF